MIKRCDWLLQYCSGQPHSYLSMSLRGDWVTPISFKSGQTQEWSRLEDERGLWRVLKWLNLMRSKVIKNHVTSSDSHPPPPQGEFLKWHKLEDNDLIYHVKITCEAKKKRGITPLGWADERPWEVGRWEEIKAKVLSHLWITLGLFFKGSPRALHFIWTQVLA